MSDLEDEVFFGHYTMKEAKRDVRKYVPKKINRRHTWSSKFSKYPATTEETIASNHNNQIIGNSVSEETIDGSIITISDASLSESEDAVTNEDSNISHNLEVSIECCTDVQLENQVNKSLYNESNAKKSSFGFEALNVSDSDEKDSASMEQQQETSKVLIPDHFSISDIDKTLELKPISKLETEKTTTQYVQDSSSSSSSEITIEPSIIGALQKNKDFDVDKLQTITRLDATSNLSPLSPIKLPQINVGQFYDSCESNDSLEDINMFLEQKVNTSSKIGDKEQFSPNIISTSGNFNNAGLQNKTTITNVLTPNTLQKCKTFYSNEKIEKRSVEVKRSTTTIKSRYQQSSKIKLPSVSARSLFPKHTKKVEVTDALKIPTKPIKMLLTPSKISNLALKNVVSPVGVYIKHSPKYSPMVKAKPDIATNSAKKLSQSIFSSVKESIPCGTLDQEFPAVIYKPAKTKLIEEKEDIILPASIKKLINIQVVTKHNGRTKDDKCNQSIERRLIESDLTIDSSYNNQDVSVLTNTQPFSIKKF